MKTISEEILEYQTAELKAGRKPTSIKLTDEQKQRLKDWLDSTPEMFITPQGELRRNNGMIYYSEGMTIFGLRII